MTGAEAKLAGQLAEAMPALDNLIKDIEARTEIEPDHPYNESWTINFIEIFGIEHPNDGNGKIVDQTIIPREAALFLLKAARNRASAKLKQLGVIP